MLMNKFPSEENIMELTLGLHADISPASVGTLIDIVVIIAIVNGGISKNKTFIFVKQYI